MSKKKKRTTVYYVAYVMHIYLFQQNTTHIQSNQPFSIGFFSMKNSGEGWNRPLPGVQYMPWISCQQSAQRRQQTPCFQLCFLLYMCTWWLLAEAPKDPLLDYVTKPDVYNAELWGLNWRAPTLLSSGALEAETPARLRSGFALWLIIIMAFSANPGFPGWAS